MATRRLSGVKRSHQYHLPSQRKARPVHLQPDFEETYARELARQLREYAAEAPCPECGASNWEADRCRECGTHRRPEPQEY